MPNPPYDGVETILQAARVRLNDAINTIAGEILTDTAPFSQTITNNAYRRLQEFLANLGYPRLTSEIIFLTVPASLSSDYGSYVQLNWAGYNNNSGPVLANPILPQDMIGPMDLWERFSGSTGNYSPMDQVLNGLPTVSKGQLNKLWEWRNDTIYMPGANGITDIRLRYSAYLPDLVTNSPIAATPWYQQLVPIVRCLNPFAWYICSEMARSRGDLDAGYFDQMAESSATEIWNRDPSQPRSIYKTSEYGKMTDKYTPVAGAAGPRGAVT